MLFRSMNDWQTGLISVYLKLEHNTDERYNKIKTDTLEQKVFVSKHAIFLEKEFLLKEDSGSKIELDEVHDPQIDMDQPTDPESITHGDELIDEPVETQAPRRSTRVRTVPEKYGFLVDQDKDVTVVENDEPTSYDDVLKSSESELWLKAMKSEMDSMYDNQVWNLVDAPEGIKPIGCK